MRLADEKAAAVAALEADGLYVLAADTVVVVDQHVLGKPADADDAKRMLRLLAGRTHEVITGVCLRGRDSYGVAFNDLRLESTEVRFEPLSDREIDDYVATGEPLDKAGAYAIQGRASRWISGIKGDYCNVVGLPVALVYRMLREHGTATDSPTHCCFNRSRALSKTSNTVCLAASVIPRRLAVFANRRDDLCIREITRR